MELPPLADRDEDIGLLANHFLGVLSEQLGRPLELAPNTLGLLQRSPWPGNVRQLRNVLERAASLADSPLIQPHDVRPRTAPGTTPPTIAPASSSPELAPGPRGEPRRFKEAKEQVLEGFERTYLTELMAAHEGNISRSADQAGLTRYHLRKLLKKHGLNPR